MCPRLRSLAAVWATALGVFAGSLAILATRGGVTVADGFYATAADLLIGLLLAFALEHGRSTTAGDQTAMALSVYVLLAASGIVALVAVADPPQQSSFMVSAIVGGLVAGLAGLLLLVWYKGEADSSAPQGVADGRGLGGADQAGDGGGALAGDDLGVDEEGDRAAAAGAGGGEEAVADGHRRA